MDQRDERRQDRRLLAPVNGSGARENPGGLVLEFAFEPEATRGVYKLLHLRAHVAIAGRSPPGDAVGPAQIRRGGVWTDVLQVSIGRDRSQRQNISLRR